MRQHKQHQRHNNHHQHKHHKHLQQAQASLRRANKHHSDAPTGITAPTSITALAGASKRHGAGACQKDSAFCKNAYEI